MKNDSRILWLDIAKGIVILLMILGHSSMPAMVSRWIYSFHMPFFFFVSGMMFMSGKVTFKDYLFHEVKVLLWPFLICSVIVLGLTIVYQPDWISYAKGVLLNGWGGMPLWFIPVFFVAKMVSYPILHCGHNKWLQIGGGILSALIGTYFCEHHILLPYNLSSVFVAAAFVCSGSFCSKWLMFFLQENNTNVSTLSVVGCSLFVIGFAISHFWCLDMCTNSVVPIIPLYVGAICGIIAILVFSIFLIRYEFLCRFLSVCGRNTFLLMAFASPVMGLWIEFVGRTVLGSTLISTVVRYLLLSLSLWLIVKFVNNHAIWILKFNKLKKTQ